MRNGAAHCPTKIAQLSLPEFFSIAESAIDPSASPKNRLDGACDVCAFNRARNAVLAHLPTFYSGFHFSNISFAINLSLIGRRYNTPHPVFRQKVSRI